ncbi:DUF2252 domain-containing protein [Schlesneria paludicola]|uniref:DUF2252 domain-containing protein n=1 Tax=Schlesneria paludicola TaxID=360056 RepID=UPI00029AEE0B|nr:DUF2252 domain-containing protein [Schlesneria paludicola]
MGKEKKSAGSETESLFETSSSLGTFFTHDEFRQMGKARRDSCPRESHAVWQPSDQRPDPLKLLTESSEGRVPHLIPIRYGRMLQSPFTFFRGAAMSMAADLSTTPTSGMRVQACGDCHLCNFGAFATPERRVIFDINDLDETLPAPWEWDVKRLAASFVLASRDNGHREDDARDAVLSCVRSYRERMAEYSEMRTMDIWYASIDVEKLIPKIQDKEAQKRVQARLTKARERSVLEHDFPELVTTAGMTPQIKDNPPLIYHQRELGRDEFAETVQNSFAAYRETLPEHRRVLLDRFKLMDLAAKVVGVGSVGTICGVLLMMASDDDPLFLQLKQARPSVLEPYAGRSAYANHGERIVVGHQLMQSASDLFLGWTEGRLGRQFYFRQLKDMKIKPIVEVFTASAMRQYGELCGWVLAHAHARSGEPIKISGYLGKGDKFDKAIAEFAVAYADQTERDHAVLIKAVRAGEIEVFVEDV